MLTAIPIPLGRTVLVFGAGATRGCTLAGLPDRPQPPLDSDFFTQIQRIKNAKHQPYVDALLQYCFDEFGAGWSLTMEQFFNYIWYTDRFRSSSALAVDLGKRTRALGVVDVFRQVLLAVLEESLFGIHSQNCLQETCSIHDALSQQLEPNDVVISFNYDCVLDSSLCTNCPYWQVDRSYGFKPIEDGGRGFWSSRFGESTAEPVKLLKLHGSINWKAEAQGVKLFSRPYTVQNGLRAFDIVPPVISKDSELRGVLPKIWAQAASSLAGAESIAVCGYSLPMADALAVALFASRMRSADKVEALRNLIIVNPDRSTRHHVLRCFRQSIGPNTRVLVFDTLEAFRGFATTGELPLR